MQEDLVSKLTGFGFTINQAKVYLSIIQNGSVTVGEIAKISQLHRQDIYKMIPILEKKGLIIKTIDKPILISAVPTEKALNRLLETEKEKISKKVSQLELNLKEINYEVSNYPHKEKTTEDQLLFQLTTDEQIKNRADLTFENAKKSYDLHINMDLINAISKILTARFQQLNKNVHIRMIIENIDKKEVYKVIQTLSIKNKQFELKLKKPSDTISYYVIDDNEIWITLKKKTESGHPEVLWTNDRNMIKFFQENFENNWNNLKLTTFHQQTTNNGSAPQSKP
jgi:sugar-specific transcriptional regulator TrmB